MKRLLPIFAPAVMLVLSIGCTSNSAEVEQLRETSPAASLPASLTSSPTVSPAAWTVIKIIDGDTVDVRSTAGTEERVRVIGIDTPERGECGFTEASTALSQITLNQQVSLVAGARDDRDRYNRILRYLDVGSTDAGLKLIEGGFAIARYDSRDGYGRHSREDVYVAADAAIGHLCGVINPTVSPAASPSLPIGVRTGLSLLYDPFGPDRNCGDFASWAQAQDFFEASGGPASDPHRLDGDHDGDVCASLPDAP
jgi:endonuclease YncB( thermonuclease family)